mgnify:CR=1 FL=1
MTHISKKISIAMMISVFVVTICFSMTIFPSKDKSFFTKGDCKSYLEITNY